MYSALGFGIGDFEWLYDMPKGTSETIKGSQPAELKPGLKKWRVLNSAMVAGFFGTSCASSRLTPVGRMASKKETVIRQHVPLRCDLILLFWLSTVSFDSIRDIFCS